MATQKDYKIIANIIKQEYARHCIDEIDSQINTRGRLIVTRIALSIADYFADSNLWFNRDTFMKACGIE